MKKSFIAFFVTFWTFTFLVVKTASFEFPLDRALLASGLVI